MSAGTKTLDSGGEKKEPYGFLAILLDCLSAVTIVLTTFLCANRVLGLFGASDGTLDVCGRSIPIVTLITYVALTVMLVWLALSIKEATFVRKVILGALPVVLEIAVLLFADYCMMKRLSFVLVMFLAVIAVAMLWLQSFCTPQKSVDKACLTLVLGQFGILSLVLTVDSLM